MFVVLESYTVTQIYIVKFSYGICARADCVARQALNMRYGWCESALREKHEYISARDYFWLYTYMLYYASLTSYISINRTHSNVCIYI